MVPIAISTETNTPAIAPRNAGYNRIPQGVTVNTPAKNTTTPSNTRLKIIFHINAEPQKSTGIVEEKDASRAQITPNTNPKKTEIIFLFTTGKHKNVQNVIRRTKKENPLHFKYLVEYYNNSP